MSSEIGLGAIMAAAFFPFKFYGWIIGKVDDQVDSITNSLLKLSGWGSLASKERPTAIAKKVVDDIKHRAKNLWPRL